MDDSSQIINDFEHILKNHAQKTPLALYSDSRNKNTLCHDTKKPCSAKDLILTVNQQIRAIQKADTSVSCKLDKKKLEKYKKSSFLPVNSLPRENKVTNKKPANRFETQCVSDTQLIDLIVNAEAIADSNNGITQEFDTTFQQIDDKNEILSKENNSTAKDIIENKNPSIDEKIISSSVLELKNLNDKSPVDSVNVEMKSVVNDENISTNTQIGLNKEFNESVNNFNQDNTSTQVSNSHSQILIKFVQNDGKENDETYNIIERDRKSKTPSPLVFDLGSFETFEKIALPILEENSDLNSVKQLINSQIIGKELLLQTNMVSISKLTKNEPTSPVLKISNENLKITKTQDINKDLKTHTNKEVFSSQNNMENNGSFLQDEILFSSDEENEYDHKEVQDIPLTCALETSFYEQPNVLDKTMYVGFQTASNRSIQITTDSFTKARSFLDEIEKDIASSRSLAELVDSLSTKHDSVNNNNTKRDDEAEIIPKDSIFSNRNNVCFLKNSPKKFETDCNETKDDREEEIEVFKRPEKRKFDGFMMASKKKIKLSDMALARCKRVFQDIDLEEDFANPKDTEAKSKEKDENKMASEYTDIDDHILQEFSLDMSLIEDENNDAVECIDFKTANKKDIIISDTTLTKNKNLFDDIDTKFDQPSTSKKNYGFKTASCKDIKISNAALKKSNEILRDIMNLDKKEAINDIEKQIKSNKVDTFTGFKTANNKGIKVSEKALLKTRYIFKDIEMENELITKEETTKTQPDKIHDLNEEMCEDLSIVFENEILDIEMEKPFSGFQTAIKKPEHISDKALQDSKNFFSDELKKCDMDVIVTSELAILKKSLTHNIANNDQFIEGLTIKENRSLSFKTANNKPINISKRALERSKKIFEDLEVIIDSNNEDMESEPFKGFESQKTKSTNIAENALVKIDSTLKDKVVNVNSDVKQFEGFKTADNKFIHVKAEALAKSKALFKNIDSKDSELSEYTKNLAHDKHKDDSKMFKGFQTANNRPITISKEALIKSKALFQDIDLFDNESKKTNNNLTSKHNPPSFKGFQTASNKLINISSEALAKSKAIFKDLDDERNDGDTIHKSDPKNKEILTFKGFQTASNKQINVSSDALARSKLLFKDMNEIEKKNDIDIEITNSNSLFKGFQTGNEKPVPISAEALASSKALFRDKDNDVNILTNTNVSSFGGFNTANQKSILISAEALAKSKAVFKDIDKSESNTKENLKEFKGFQTASNKAVKVSEGALIKSKKIFDEIDNCKENETNLVQFEGFQTASNKKVNISEQALKRTRQIFQDIYLSENFKKITETNTEIVEEGDNSSPSYDIRKKANRKITTESSKQSEKAKVLLSNQTKKLDFVNPQETLEKLIDTQIINDFEETLYTEDFCKTTPRPIKRSGSPILSCPRAKKRKKFATPFKIDGKSPITDLKTLNKDAYIEKESAMLFNMDYKKNKRLKLKDLAKVEEKSKNTNIDPYILNFNLDNFLEFVFVGQRNDLTDEKLSIADLKDIFENAVNRKLIPIGWIENHLKLIIWKLTSYEVNFPKTLTGVCTAKNVIEQLKYRFDRELYNAERPALRKILEKDDVASKTMVLCVAGVFADGINVKSVTNIASNIELLLSDGWYCIKACIDKMLTKLVFDEKITIGCKIVTTGAELMNCEQGVAPWEDTTAVRLKIFGNSTRRARWDDRLGYHGDAAILTKLSSVKPEGGKVSKLRLFVARAYPMLYVEKFEDGSTVTRSERLEHIHQVKFESERQTTMEKLYEEVEKELSDQESQDSLDSQMASKHRKMDGFIITESQAKSLEDRSNRKRERLLLNIQERVRKKIEQKGLHVGRNVVTLMKVRVAGVEGGDGHVSVTKGFLSIWKPNDMLTEIIREGAWIEVMNIVPTAVRYSEIHLSAGRLSVFSQSKYQESNHMKPYINSLRRKCYHIKDLAQNPTMATDYNEIDTVGLIFHIDEISSQPFQNVYLTDSEKNIICINFWGGLLKFGFQNILEVGHVIYGTNLQKRAGNTRKSIPHFRVTEFTNFTKTPKNIDGRNVIEALEKKLSDFDNKKYCEECVILKNNFSSKNRTENVSPYRFHDHSLNKNNVLIDSPLATKCEDNFNLTGLDFESTFKQTDTQEMSPKTLQRKRQVEQKIAKLKMIGEPPALSPLNIINKSRCAFNSYRSPLANSVASPKNIYQNSRIQDRSPVNNSNQTNVTNVNNCQNSSFNNITSSPVIQSVNKSKSVSILKESYQNSRINNDLPSSPLMQNIDTKKFQKVTSEKQASQLFKINVAKVKKSYENSRISKDIQSSPVFGINRTYVKNVNPVKLNFSAQDNSLDEVVDHFAEEFDGSPPLSLD